MKNELFVTAEETAQELGVSQSFAYKLVWQVNVTLEENG